MNAIPRPGLHIPIEFTDVDGVPHRAESWEALAHKVTQYRVDAGFVVGEPLKEIYAQACVNYPERCKPLDRKRPRAYNALNKRVLGWIIDMLVFHQKDLLGKQTDPYTLVHRTTICKQCPMQKSWKSDCKHCSVQVEQVAKGILPSVELDAALKACDVLGEDTRVSVHINQAGSDDPDLPHFCWRRK